MVCVLSLVFGPLPDTGSPRVPVRAFPSLHVVPEFAFPAPSFPDIQRTDILMGAAELRVERGSSATVNKQWMDSQISGFFSCGGGF